MQTLDTLEVAKDLRAAGFTDAQAEALTRAVRKAQVFDTSSLATKAELAAVKEDVHSLKADVQALRSELKIEIAGVRAEIAGVRAEIAGVKADLQRWIVGAVGIQTLAILGTILALARLVIR